MEGNPFRIICLAKKKQALNMLLVKGDIIFYISYMSNQHGIISFKHLIRTYPLGRVNPINKAEDAEKIGQGFYHTCTLKFYSEIWRVLAAIMKMVAILKTSSSPFNSPSSTFTTYMYQILLRSDKNRLTLFQWPFSKYRPFWQFRV